MSHTVCTDIGNWVDQNIEQQVEQCYEQDCNWWCLCCNKWFCFLAWVVVVIVTWVVQTVCEVVADVVDLVRIVVTGIVDVLVGLFTGDWTRLAAGLGEIVGGIINFVANLIPIATGGTLVGAFEDSRNAWRLRDYVRGLLEDKYKDQDPAGFDRMVDALGIDSGGFGLRLKIKAYRTFIRSDYSTQRDGTPDLVIWLRDPRFNLDLKSLAGFNPPAWWTRQWPELVGDTGDITEADLDNYIAQSGRGPSVKKFTLYSMSLDAMMSRLDVATRHATEIGLILQWSTEDVQVQSGDQILINSDNFPPVLPEKPFARTRAADNMVLATEELCKPMAIAAFAIVGNTGNNGISATLAQGDCLEADDRGSKTLPASGITGSAFRYRQPDLAFQYVAIHELGHTFGLCHVDGLLRIMYTASRGVSSSSSWWQYWTTGTEAGFVYDEATRVWDYIVRNFGSECLQTRQF
jgi:hypothetical protein